MKILGITTIRSDYDLMSGLYRKLDADPGIDFRLIVAGAQMSKKFGSGCSQVAEDGFNILAKIENLIDGDSNSSRVKSASILMQVSIDIVAGFQPDIIIYAGDREDVMVFATIGAYLGIPTVHFFGGDHTNKGNVDNRIRHAVSKLSTMHFVSTEKHARRLYSIGESASRIHVVGSIALDRFMEHVPLSHAELCAVFPSFCSWQKYALVLYHPQKEETIPPAKCFTNILENLERIGLNAFVGFPNTDPGHYEIIREIEARSTSDRFIFYQTLKRNVFLSIFKGADLIIGNSSAGILESSSIPIPAVDIGGRQAGRDAPGNVISCSCSSEDLQVALTKALSEEFVTSIVGMKNPFGDGHSIERAYKLLKFLNFNMLLDKREDPLNE